MSWTAPPFDGTGSLRGAAAVEHWLSAAVEAGRRHGLEAREPRLFPTGSDVVVDCGDFVFKMTAPRWAGEIEAEHGLLARVSGHLPVASPEPLAHGRLDGWPFVLMSRLPGRALAEHWPALDSADRRRLTRAIGELLASLHALPVSEAEAAPWPGFLDSLRGNVVERLRKTGGSEEWLARIEPFFEDLGPLSPGTSAWLHTELYDQHLLVEERGGRLELTGVIDFADGRVGHPGYEIPAAVEFFLRGERPLLRELLLGAGWPESELDERLSRELCAWSLLHRFGHLPRLLEAAGDTEPAGFEELAERLYGFA